MQCWCLVTHCDNNRACTKARYTLSTTEVIFQDFPSMENTTFKDFEKISGGAAMQCWCLVTHCDNNRALHY